MRATSADIRLSASDLSNHLSCRHLTNLDLAVAIGEKAPPDWHPPDARVLRERGLEHERAYLAHLAGSGLEVRNLQETEDDRQAFSDTCKAMTTGAAVIAQGTLADGHWFGRPDVLRRIEQPSDLGRWSYEVLDTKLARETKSATILQLSLYSEMVAAIQGVLPGWMYVVPPTPEFREEPYRVLDYAAYFRSVKARLQEAVRANGDRKESYPEPTPHCPVCRWWRECNSQLRRDDHLSLVAGITRLQRKQFAVWETTTVEDLARFPVPIRQRPDHGSRDSYFRVREQARVQVSGRRQGRSVYELLEVISDRGLCRLPEPSPGDVFFDLESDPFVGYSGREYLFGFSSLDDAGQLVYESRLALTAGDEKRAFEWFVDEMMSRWAKHPAMHVYHYAPYEPSALKRLMGRYSTREDEIDRMLRAGFLVDLRTVTKQAVRASVEEYSLKALEALHGFKRVVPLEDAQTAMRQMEHSLESGDAATTWKAVGEAIRGYNRDDCDSTYSLRGWLEDRRLETERNGHRVPRPEPKDGAPSEALSDRQQRVATLVEQLQAGISSDPEHRTEEESARWLLSNLLDWHRRENKAEIGEYYRLCDFDDEQLLDEKCALAGLEFVERLSIDRKIPTDRYRFEKQETDLRKGDKLSQRGEGIGKVVGVDISARTIDIKKTKKTADIHPFSVFRDGRGPMDYVLADSLFRLGESVAAQGIVSPGAYKAARDLLLRRAPQLKGDDQTLRRPHESPTDAAKRLATKLEDSTLAIQGPPGSGKTYSGARMICELVLAGQKVGITAVSHKVIRNLIDATRDAAREFGLQKLSCLQKIGQETEEELPDGLETTTDNGEALTALQCGTASVVGGTAWLWSREDFFESIDVLFVDEAGQMSLANVLAVAQAARSVVLLGDPQQLEQPQRGSHPEGAESSALGHLLAGAKTIPADKGLFLDSTWRLHPKVCQFTSEVFYEARLQSHEGMENQRIGGHPVFHGAGLWFIPVEHDGNLNSSPEEVTRVASLVEDLLQSNVTWTDDQNRVRPLRSDDILIVAPYNAQVSDLAARLPGARVGTVDKFQGQEAPVVIYSLTTSSPEDAPRGMEFLYSLNRLNVATSRAKAVAIIVGNARLLEPDCRSPRQMQLANALCRFVELAETPGSALGAG